MNIYATAGLGLSYLFWGKIITLFGVLPLVGVVALIIGTIVSLYGLYTMSKAGDDYTLALVLTVVGMVFNIFSPEGGILGFLCETAITLMNVAVFYLICSKTGQLLCGVDNATAAQGEAIWKAILVCAAIQIVCDILMCVPIVSILALVISAVAILAQAVVSILYLVFLWKSQKALQGVE